MQVEDKLRQFPCYRKRKRELNSSSVPTYTFNSSQVRAGQMSLAKNVNTQNSDSYQQSVAPAPPTPPKYFLGDRQQQGKKNIKPNPTAVATDTPHRANEQSTQEGTEIEVADGNLTLELPAAGSTVEKPPDGGVVAWKIVAACGILNACSTTCVLILSLSNSGLKKDFGEDVIDNITTACLKIQHLAGLGLACWYLCSLIPILEYFERKRLRAITISRLCAIVVSIIIFAVYIDLLMKGYMINWRTAFMCMLIPGAVGLSVSIYLQPLQLKMKEDKGGRTFVERTLGISTFQLFKDITFYLVMLAFFFDQFGRGIPADYINALMTDKSFTLMENLIQILLLPFGTLLGAISLFFWKSKGLNVSLLVFGFMDLYVGYLTLQMPAYDKYGWVAVYSITFGITKVIIISLIENTIPDTFGDRNTRIVAGFFGFSAGLGELVASMAAEDANNRYKKDEYSAAFYLAASTILAAGVCALSSRFLLIRKMSKAVASANENDDDRDGNDASSSTGCKTHKGDNPKNNKNEDIDITDMEYVY
ncbi:monocarboxylate transporter 4-like [Ylistrum balloti]|uniref:monocarboxylate transporter 4-like n=1 Tax=Ylistrum balloti TaxID=509963 RepID=UPI002905E703|nr:monocarboxylate transporter 4-like [Ylistrum balloti]